MDKRWLNEISLKILEFYDPLRMTGAQDVVMPGLFKGNRVLFVAQNPGLLKESVPDDMTYKTTYQAFKNNPHLSPAYALTVLEDTYEKALRSPKGTLGTFINDIYGEDWKDISITNVYKCPFDKNIVPQVIPDQDIRVLAMQIGALKPDIIVYIGSLARQASHYQISGPKILHVAHPSYLRKTGQYEQAVGMYAAELDHLLNVS